MYKSIRGTKDILPPEIFLWQEIEIKARDILNLYGYEEIRTPLIEEAGLFNRSLGSFSEVVNKQMFHVKRIFEYEDREEKDLVLRPEATASVARAYIENNLDKSRDFVKFFYIGPMFRAERPQKGRLRQFHHLGVEAIGSYSAYLDVELIMLAKHLLEEFGIEGFVININSIGCNNDKNKFSLFIKNILKKKTADLCQDCQRRYQNNVLRILDCKNKNCQQILKELTIEHDYLCNDCVRHFNEVKEGLDSLDIKYKISPLLVRGLDYYTRTVFEITHSGLGSQDAIGAGGRYDNLLKELGGPQKGAIGFALGIERLILVIKRKELLPSKQWLVFLVTLGRASRIEGLKLLMALRKKRIAIDTDYQDKSLKAALRRANSLKAKFVIILGEEELNRGVVKIKDMENAIQKEVEIEKLIAGPEDFLC